MKKVYRKLCVDCRKLRPRNKLYKDRKEGHCYDCHSFQTRTYNCSIANFTYKKIKKIQSLGVDK